jgi:hypothetical protein
MGTSLSPTEQARIMEKARSQTKNANVLKAIEQVVYAQDQLEVKNAFEFADAVLDDKEREEARKVLNILT